MINITSYVISVKGSAILDFTMLKPPYEYQE